MADSGDGVPGPAGLGGSGSVVLDGMRVLRLCSVFEPATLSGRSAGYDAIGGMHGSPAPALSAACECVVGNPLPADPALRSALP